MVWTAGIVGLVSLALAPAVVSPAPPPDGGPWQRVGVAVASRPGKSVALFRFVRVPEALALVVTSSSPQAVRASWTSYCEIGDDDGPNEELQGVLRAVGRVVVLPLVMNGSSSCTVTAFLSVPGGGGTATVTAAVFAR